MAFAVADSGFTIQTTAEAYSSGNVIDLGWFLGFALILLAALRTPRAQAGAEDDDLPTRQIGNLLPYIAVTVALLTSAVEVLRTGHADVFVSWVRTLIMLLLVVRQVLTLLENQSLTRNLERRVRERTAELQASRAAVRGPGPAQLGRRDGGRPVRRSWRTRAAPSSGSSATSRRSCRAA